MKTILPNKVLYGKSNLAKNESGFATVLVDDYGLRKASLTEHSTIGEARKDAENRKELYRILFGEIIHITNDTSDVEFYLLETQQA